MIVPSEPFFVNPPASSMARDAAIPSDSPMLTPSNAWRILELRTGINIGRSTFYRWIQCGRVFSLKMGGKIVVPWGELEHVIRQCRNGERL
ncbi:MAG TPA: hypothetical protein VL523_19190 [Terriglobia bacterium]|nr:hypothetical protein [Terriglobia bacterium]